MPDRQTLARKLAATYEGGRYDDPWAYVEAYRAYTAYTADYPEAGSTAVASALDQPRGRIRVWMDGSKPDPVRAIEIAESHGWLDWDWNTDTTQALNCLVAWIFAGGSITADRYVPLFTVDRRDQEGILRDLLSAAVDARPQRNERGANRARELTIREHQSVFGRMMHALGAPTGAKNETRTDLTLPSYLRTAPEHTRRSFARTYVWLRGTERQDRPNQPVQIAENRTPKYWQELRALLNGLVPGAVAGVKPPIRLSQAAADELYRPPSVPRHPAE